MDNETYLKHISAQARPAPATGRLITPTMIKIIAGAIIALVLIIVLGSVLNAANQRNITLHERLYLRLQNLSAEDGPLTTYGTILRSSDLRSLAGTLKTSLTVTARDLNGILADLRVDPAAISETATNEENTIRMTYEGELRDAQLNGILDRTFASSTALQISLLLSLQSDVRERTDNATLASILDRSTSDLNALLESFTQYSNTSR